MTIRNQRNPFVNLNPYQQRIILAIMLPALLACLICLFSLIYVYYISSHLVFYSKVDFSRPDIYVPWFLKINRLAAVIPWVLFIIASIMFAVIVWSYEFSNRIAGPHERIVRELDDILAGKGKKPIILRSRDDMFLELTKKINQLVDKLPGH